MKVKRNANDNFALIFVLPRCKNKRGLCSLGEVSEVLEPTFPCNPEYLGYCTADISYNLTVGAPISRRPVVALISTTYKPDL